MRVLVAYDGGEHGRRMLVAIAGWVRDTNADVQLVTVIHPRDFHDTVRPHESHALTPAATPTGQLLGVTEPMATIAEDRTQALAAGRVRTEEGLVEAARELLPGTTVEAHAEMAEDTAGAISRLAAKLNCEVIAIGTHGRKGVTHALMGSVAEAVVRTASVPVIVVGPKCTTGQ